MIRYWPALMLCGCGRLDFDAPGTRTFGKTAVGATSDYSNLDNVRVSAATLSEPGTVTTIWMYLDSSRVGPGARARGLIFDSLDTGEPGALVAHSPDLSFSPAPAGWVAFVLDPPVRLAPGDYWLGDAASDTGVYYYFDFAPAGVRYGADPFDSGPGPVFNETGPDNRAMSVYAEYSVY